MTIIKLTHNTDHATRTALDHTITALDTKYGYADDCSTVTIDSNTAETTLHYTNALIYVEDIQAIVGSTATVNVS